MIDENEYGNQVLGDAGTSAATGIIETWVKEIIDRLKSQISNAVIEDFPDKPSAYIFRHPVAAILVRYAGGDFSTPEPTDIVVQEHTPAFDFTLYTRSLRFKNAGAYYFLEKIRAALTGFKPSGCARMYPKQERFVREDNGEWEHFILFATSTKHAEVPKERQKIEYTEGEGYADEL